MTSKQWYWIFKYIVMGPFLKLYNRPEITGAENIPHTGGVILASNHQSVMDSFYLPLMISRHVTFLAKSEYFTGTGVIGAIQRWFFNTVGQVPLDRTSSDAKAALEEAAARILTNGEVLGIYPEGTRSPDGRIYRGKTGMAHIALKLGVPVVPVAMIGARKANPIGSWILRPHKVGLRIGEPIDARAYITGLGLDPETHEAKRAFTDYFMKTLVELAQADYVDIYASTVKESLAAGKGYPRGAEPQV
ncbi:1-acyl-sn-glycerol-3-phosphate acyltransferase [Corynebacterium sp. ES2794-CONJ1]|uniref:lysophospholipid acyltransferase family protein n=1 Tax=Corynebacterium sp. ES2794-CONJ1 TaxID=2980553 RepID=UPI0021D98DDA|nr:lysophospholipid acyltransferase family protein [Corynebacterium sp. ES2794-CONJ1]MCU9518679.1 1-acyl-sn-glycerol-3-phosphate acyltransferase [Corynebacterium sp. ES2794-CONJ1]